jgi:DNA (cytosine-5)-methyltransferase 1
VARRKLRLLSLFAGAGGLDLAFELTERFVTGTAVEVQPEFCETLRQNQRRGFLAHSRVVRADIRELKPGDLFPLGGSPQGVIGGPPCESFSSMGLRKGGADPRGRLVIEFASWATKLSVDFFLMENVPDLLTIDAGRIFDAAVERLEAGGFSVSFEVLNAADFGDATVRRRLFVVGFRGGGRFVFPEPTYAEPVGSGMNGRKPWRTVGEVIGNLPQASPVPPGRPLGHVLVKHTARVRERFARLPQGSYDNVRKRSRLSWNRPSPSLVAGNLQGIRSHIHPLEPRELTSRECARIQGFPDSFDFRGSPAAVGKQIANAVPIGVGVALARSIADQVL